VAALIPKPKGLERQYGDQFADAAIVAAYRHRPAYAPEVFTFLRDLVIGQPRSVLDLGCGTGDVARPLAALVDTVDAVDPAHRMIEHGRSLPGGDRSNLRWILGYAEEVQLPRGTYGLVTAGESLHWMDWSRLLPRLNGLLVPGGFLAIVERNVAPNPPWWTEVLVPIQQYTTNRDFQPYSTIAELEQRGLFEPCGVHQAAARRFQQSVESYIESIHSRNGFSRDRLTPEAAAAFDAEVRRLLIARYPHGTLAFDIVSQITWGRPVGNQTSEVRSQPDHATRPGSSLS